MNILIIGNKNTEENLVELCCKSKLLKHIYTASQEVLEKVPNIEYSDFQDLVIKIKALQIDLVLLADKALIEEGLVELFRKNFINVISVNKKWLNLESSRLIAKQLMSHYSINFPETIKAPMFFPIVIKTDNQNSTKVANSMQELIEIKESLVTQTTFLEEFLEGDIIFLTSLWDGKNLVAFDKELNLTEVQSDRLDLYKTKLNFLFIIKTTIPSIKMVSTNALSISNIFLTS